MAQTIAIQRGTTSMASDGTTSVTLFTQSGGIATRVIVNQLTMYFANLINAGVFSAVLYHTSSGGYSSVIGQVRSGDGPGASAIQFQEGSSTTNPFTGVFNSNNSTVSPSSPIMVAIGNAGTDMFSPSAANISVNYSGANQRFSSLASNFYIGPGDSLRMKVNGRYNSGKNQPSTTVNIGWSFTTITET